MLTAAKLRVQCVHAEVLAAEATVPRAHGAHVGAAGPANVPGPQVTQTDEEIAPTMAEAVPSAQPAHEKAPAEPTRKRPAGHTTGEAVGVIEGVGEVEGVMDGVGLALTTHNGVAPPVHAQLPSGTVFARTPPLPVAGAAHENVYEVEPAVGVAGVTTVLAKAASDGCESAAISIVDSVRA